MLPFLILAPCYCPMISTSYTFCGVELILYDCVMPCRMQKLAKELGVVLPVSFFEEANNAHYNSIAIIDADGTDLGLYRKSHIPDGPGMRDAGLFPTLNIK